MRKYILTFEKYPNEPLTILDDELNWKVTDSNETQYGWNRKYSAHVTYKDIEMTFHRWTNEFDFVDSYPEIDCNESVNFNVEEYEN